MLESQPARSTPGPSDDSSQELSITYSRDGTRRPEMRKLIAPIRLPTLSLHRVRLGACSSLCSLQCLDASVQFTGHKGHFRGGVRRIGKLCDESGSRFAQWGAHLMEILEDLSVGLQRATLSIGYGALLAERSDDGLSLLQFVPRHAGE
jgi:hypothetical protein